MRARFLGFPRAFSKIYGAFPAGVEMRAALAQTSSLPALRLYHKSGRKSTQFLHQGAPGRVFDRRNAAQGRPCGLKAPDRALPLRPAGPPGVWEICR